MTCNFGPRPSTLAAQESFSPNAAATEGKAPSTEISPAPEKSNGTVTIDSLSREVRYLLDDQGKLVPLWYDAKLSQFLDWLKTRQAPPNLAQPTVSVSSIELSGTADEQLVTLTAKLRLQVVGATEPVLFPLGLSEAVVLKSQAKGPGDSYFGGKDRDRGLLWWFCCNGIYDLDLELAVPLRKAAPWRRLQLTLPSAPVANLSLTLPLAVPAVKAADEMLVKLTPLDEDHSQLSVAGFGTRLDLSWQPTTAVSDLPASLDVNSTLLVRGTGNGYIVDCTQYVKALRGAFSQFTVRLPTKSELLQVEGVDVRETKADPTNPERITVALNGSTAGPVMVKWQVRIPSSDRKRTILDGFSVETARRQSGEIGLIAAEGARWTLSDSTDSKLERMNAGELRNAVSGANVVRAYRFYEQPLRLPLVQESEDPYYDVQPTLVLHASESELRLEGRFDVRTFRGNLAELALKWPGWRTEGWVLESIQPQGTVVAGLSTDDVSGDGRIAIALAESAPQSFQLRLVARAPIRATEDVRLSFPRVDGPSNSSTRLLFLHAENVDAEIAARGETAIYPLPEEAAVTSQSLGYPAGQPVRQFRLETDERVVSVRVVRQPRRVSVTSQSRVALSGRRLTIRQQLEHLVQYERLSELTLVVPAALAQRVKFFWSDRELRPEWSTESGANMRLAKLLLPEPRLGNVSIVAEWDLPLSSEFWAEREAEIVIPQLSSLAAATTRSEVEFVKTAWLELAAADAEWVLQYTGAESTRWSLAGAPHEFVAVMTPAVGDEGGDFIANRAAVWCLVDRTGSQRYRLHLKLSGDSPQLNLQLPAQASLSTISWDGSPLSGDDILELPPGSRKFMLRLPEARERSREHALTLDYLLPGNGPLGVTAELKTQLPALPQCRWVAQIIWQLQLPADQHLFSYPATASPLFHWERTGLLWRRTSLMSDVDVRRWLSSGNLLEPPEPRPASHTYSFTQFGPLQNLSLRSLSSAAALVCGTGFSLLIGFLVIKVPLFRSMLAVLTICCGLMLAAVWYLPQFELLVQPMLLGAALSLMLGLLDLWNRRRASGTVLTLATTPSDFRVPGGDGSATHSLFVHQPDSATVFREPAPSEGSKPRVAAESHVG